jgi:beta-xylosidase
MKLTRPISWLLAMSGFGRAKAYTHPVLWNDLADLDVFRVNDTYYYSVFTMAYSPGAPILQSKDLVNWEHIGHSVPRLGIDMAYATLPRRSLGVMWSFEVSLRRQDERNGVFLE